MPLTLAFCVDLFSASVDQGLALQLSSNILSGFFYGNTFVNLKYCHSFLKHLEDMPPKVFAVSFELFRLVRSILRS